MRKVTSDAAGAPLILAAHTDDRSLGFVQRADIGDISQHGPATPDHVIRTKRVPLLGRGVDGFADAYRDYFQEHANEKLQMLDPAPRVILDPELGRGNARPHRAGCVDCLRRLRAHHRHRSCAPTALGGYEALPAKDIFDVEYWDLEQAKLRRGGSPPAVRRRNRPDHRRGLGHRQSRGRVVPEARRCRGRHRPESGHRRAALSGRLPGRALRCDRSSPG